MKTLKRLWLFVLRVFRVSNERSNNKRRKHPYRRKRQRLVAEGGFKDLRSLFNGLDDTFDKLGRLSSRGSLPKMLKKHGPFIVSGDWGEDAGIESGHLEGFKTYGLPAILFCNIPWKNSKHDDGFSHFSWALKTNKVPHVQRRPGFTYYEYGAYWPKDGKRSEFGVSTFVGVHKQTGQVIAVPTFWERPVRVCVNGQRPKTIYQPCYEYVALRERAETSNKEVLIQDFCLLYSLVMRREFGANIVVSKNGMKATFIVPENEWKYFFRERMDSITKAGKKVPIFHAVMAHHRLLSSGKVSNVKTHYRGSRFFVWNGYSVSIVIPERHGASQATFDLESYEDKPENGKLVDASDVDLSEVFGHKRVA